MPQSDKANTKKSSFLSSIGIPSRKWSSVNIPQVNDIKESDVTLYGGGSTTIASLLGNDRRSAKDRQTIYNKWGMMESDPVVSTALRLLVTSALGGHETSGEVVFIEKTAEAKDDKRLSALVDEISAELSPIFNRIAFQSAYTGATFGDSYARVYASRKGVIDLYIDELVRPPLVQPFERGNKTVGYAVYIGQRNFERLSIAQMARLKMPRTQWVPQHGVVEKALRVAITEDDIEKLPLLPSMAGGSLLYNAEEPYDNLYASLLGVVGQRWIDSIDEQMLSVNLTQMTIEQQQRFIESIKSMLTASKTRAENAVKDGRPVLERIRHIIPVFNEKQLTTVTPANGGQSGRAGNISVEDIILHARLLSGAIGVDLSMLGFADQLAGGLGEGGFFRTSAQAAESSRIIRSSLSDFFNQIIDIHTMLKYGVVFNQGDRPWIINFYGSISALEAEKQRTRADAMNAGMLLAQAMQSMKDMGANEEIMEEFLAKNMMLDEDQAKLFATIVKTKDDLTGEENDEGGFSNNDKTRFDSAISYDDYFLLDGIGQITAIPIPAKTIKWLGFESAMSLKADLHALAERHREYYDGDPDAVLSDIKFVLANPDDWFIHHGSRIVIFRERIGRGSIPLVRIELDIIAGAFIARSVYVSGRNQIVKKIKERNKAFARFGRSGQSSGSLSVAEYLQALGNGSLRPVPPSGGSPKA